MKSLIVILKELMNELMEIFHIKSNNTRPYSEAQL